MYVAEYIDPTFESLSPANTAREARLIMEAQDIESLPVVSDDGIYITMLSLEDIDQLLEDTTIEIISGRFQARFVHKDKHVFEAIRLMLDHDLECLPVVDDASLTYSGLATRSSVLESLVAFVPFRRTSYIITIEAEKRGFSLSELCRLIESNRGQIVGTLIHDHSEENSPLRITINLVAEELNPIFAVLERYDYVVRRSYQGEQPDDYLKERYQSLMRFLDT
tara:strand:+ start:87 stop:755 length:669 start_codon:yes stop_codon:yes gene_type:complete